ncbi:MAG: hypothetical protein L6R35_000521 [Caloplaca aegaea]|nr:MAG: hypothetical protein L6R35_000521 [Caloplaca aegaea]
MAPVKKQFGWRSAARATERAQGKDARTAPAASAPQSVNERIEARNERTMALLGPKVAMALARRREADRVKKVRMEERMAEEARVARQALELEELLRLSVIVLHHRRPSSSPSSIVIVVVPPHHCHLSSSSSFSLTIILRHPRPSSSSSSSSSSSLTIVSFISFLLSIFQGPNSGVTPRAPKKVVHFAEEEEVLCEFEKYDHGEYEPERYDRAAADFKAGRRGPGVVNGYDLFYGSDCEISDDDDW